MVEQVAAQPKWRVLVVHTDPSQREEIEECLVSASYRVRALDLRDGLGDTADGPHFHIIVIPLSPEQAGSGADDPLAAVRRLRKVSPSSQIVALVAPAESVEVCCEAVSLGVGGFVEVDSELPREDFLARIHQAGQRYDASERDGRELHNRQIFDQTGFAGQSEAMAELLMRARQAASVSDAPVLIYGESGTGKQLLAEAIHRLDPKRSKHPFLSVNCGAISGTLAESALFGHSRGAFTGATEVRLGHFRAASGGTILLDEIGDLPVELQPKLLRVLQSGMVLPLGMDREVPVDVRVIAASNRLLEEMVGRNEFRLDLYQRLNVIRLDMPALDQRPEDIPALFQFFLGKYASYYARPIRRVNPRVYEVLARQLGDGNVRELENLVRRILVFKKFGDEIDLDDLPPAMLKVAGHRRSSGPARLAPALADAVVQLLNQGEVPLSQMINQCEKMILEQVLAKHQGTHTQIARKLGITRRTYYNKLRKHDLASLSNEC